MFLKDLSKYSSVKSGLDYHDELNQKIWDGEVLRPEVHKALSRISDKFIEFLAVDKNTVEDVIITGSICNYNWTKFSDIDLHILLRYDEFCTDCKTYSFDDCMKAKKTLWNDSHDITIYGFDVELYAQSSDDAVTGNAGVYSVKNKKWTKLPKKEKVNLEDEMIMYKASRIMSLIDTIVDQKVNDLDQIQEIKDRIKKMRKSGLEKGGEYGLENLVFKALRNNGYIEKLHDYYSTIEDQDLSLEKK